MLGEVDTYSNNLLDLFTKTINDDFKFSDEKLKEVLREWQALRVQQFKIE